MPFVRSANYVNVRITHKKAQVPAIEAVAFKDRRSALTGIRSIANVEECVLLQTCNRLELYAVSKDCEKTAEILGEYLIKRAGTTAEEVSRTIEMSLDQDALRHLLRIASGLESMIVGEDQILGQVWDAYLEAKSVGTAGPVLKTVFTKAVSVGRRVRNKTGINKGTVSIGSAAVELANSLLGDLNGRNVLVIGAGETGTLVAKALARCHLSAIFVANRTYERALKLAEELEGKAVKFDRLEEALIDAEVVICSTSAPHYLLTRELIYEVMKHHHQSNLVIIDISNPRNVDESINDIEGVTLYNLDNLQMITERTEEERHKSVEKASKIIEEELILLNQDLKAQSVRSIISSLLSRTEKMRQRELTKALNMLGNVDAKEKQIIDDLSSILLKQTFIPIIENLRMAAAKDDNQLIDAAIKLLGTKAI